VPTGGGFRWLLAGNASANLADGVTFVAIPLIATTLTTDPTLIAGLSLAYSLVRMLLVVPIGVLVDRIDHRTLLWTANLVRGGLLIGLAVIFAAGLGSLPLLYLMFAAIGVLETAADNAGLAVVPAMVRPDDLDRANGRIATTQLVADEFVGPPLGGFLFGLALAAPVAVTGGLYAAAGMIFLALPRRVLPPGPATGATRNRFWRDAFEGLQWLRGHRRLLALAITNGLACIAYLAAFSVLVLYAGQVLRLDPTGYGILLAVSAVGGLIGSFVAAPLRQRFGYRRVLVGSLILGSVTMIGLAFTDNAFVAAGLLAAYILHATIWNVCGVALRQRLVPEAMRGRNNSLFKLSGLIGLVIGAAIAGPLADGLSLAAPFAVAGVIFAGGTVLTWVTARDDPE
jgi:predicted MFS family arabinose efflux permease